MVGHFWCVLMLLFAGDVCCRQKYKGRWIASGNRTYFWSTEERTTFEVERVCGNLGATVVVFNSKAEYDAARRIKPHEEHYWMGLRYDPGERLLQWDDGSYYNYIERQHYFLQRTYETRFVMKNNKYTWDFEENYKEDTWNRKASILNKN